MGELIFYCQHHNMVKSSLASAQVVRSRNTQEEAAKNTAQKEHVVLLQMP